MSAWSVGPRLSLCTHFERLHVESITSSSALIPRFSEGPLE